MVTKYTKRKHGRHLWFVLLWEKKKIPLTRLDRVSLPPAAAEKVTENLAEMTGQVAPCDVSSVYGIRRAMGIAVPAEPPESFIDLTTGEYLVRK